MNKKILVIDDDQDILDLTEILFKESGYDVVASLTPNILDEIAQIKPDVILLDDWLGTTTGHEECKHLKSAEETKDIPVIIFSAATGLEKIADDCHADDFVEKPFNIHHLVEVIERHSCPHSGSGRNSDEGQAKVKG